MQQLDLSVTGLRYTCEHCLSQFEAKRRAVYCSPACKQAAWRKKHQPVIEAQTKADDHVLESLVEQALERCQEQDIDPKDLLLYMQLQEIKTLLSRFDERRKKQFVMMLVSWAFEENLSNV